MRGHGDWVAQFNRGIIEATSDLVCAYKPNLAFSEALGKEGMDGLREPLTAIPPDALATGLRSRGTSGATPAPYATALPRVCGPIRACAAGAGPTPGSPAAGTARATSAVSGGKP